MATFFMYLFFGTLVLTFLLWSFHAGGWWLGIIAAVIFLVLIGVFTDTKKYYCRDCGQYLGTGDAGKKQCPRCGCNIYTEINPGVGRTTKIR